MDGANGGGAGGAEGGEADHDHDHEHGHAGVRSTQEFTGNMVGVILGILFCLPLGIIYYFSEREEVWICPACQESISVGANTCPHCGEDITEHK